MTCGMLIVSVRSLCESEVSCLVIAVTATVLGYPGGGGGLEDVRELNNEEYLREEQQYISALHTDIQVFFPLSCHVTSKQISTLRKRM